MHQGGKMALPQVISRNPIQKQNERQLLQNDVLQPTTYYTCPAGKIARIKGTWLCEDTGAAATVDLNAAGISIAEVQATGGGTDPNVPQDLAEGLLFPFDIILVATETLDVSQNTGTNADTLINAVITESPV